jgi:hypothetical protein
MKQTLIQNLASVCILVASCITPSHLSAQTASTFDPGSLIFRVRFAKAPGVVEGADGRKILVPDGWKSGVGALRMIAYPPNWQTNQGHDGRLVAAPVGWVWDEDPDGRMVPRPTNGISEVGRDRRRAARPKNWLWNEGQDGRRVARPPDWTWDEGMDGRRVVRPTSWPWEEGADGRRVARPANWTWDEGFDGRRAVRPADWITSRGKDRRLIAHRVGVKTDQGRDGRLFVVPDAGKAEFILVDARLHAMVSELKQNSHLTSTDATNLLLYWYINEQDDQ